MDPNETLRLMREALEQGADEVAAEHARSLDEWMSKGGFPPAAWGQG